MEKMNSVDTQWIVITVQSEKEEKLFLEDITPLHGDCHVFLSYADARDYAADLVERKVLPADSLNSKVVTLQLLTDLVKRVSKSSPEKRFSVSLYQNLPSGEMSYVDTLVDSKTN